VFGTNFANFIYRLLEPDLLKKQTGTSRLEGYASTMLGTNVTDFIHSLRVPTMPIQTSGDVGYGGFSS